MSTTMQQALRHLVNVLVIENGNGYTELAKCIEKGEIKEEEAVVVAFYASLERLDKKLNIVLNKLSATPI